MPKKMSWTTKSCWVASFDILGFKNMANTTENGFKAFCVMDDYEATLNRLESSCSEYEEGILDYFWLSDTFVMFTSDDSAKSYAIAQQAAKSFIEECIYSGVPIRGAVSVGQFTLSGDRRALIGQEFIDAFVTGEDQDWLGLLLTKSAIEKARSYGLDPANHDFVSSKDTPMRKFSATDVMAYRFQNGSANFESPLIAVLAGMMESAGSPHNLKYQRTIDFIRKFYQKLIL